MTSFFPFYSSTPSTSSANANSKPPAGILDEKSNLEVTVTPSSSAFYAGETFSITINFRNTRTPASGAAYPLTPATATAAPTPDIVNTAASSARQLPPYDRSTHTPRILPRRRRQIGLDLPDSPFNVNAEAGPSRIVTPLGSRSEDAYPYSPGANPDYRATGWPTSPQRNGPLNFRSPEGWAEKEYSGLGEDRPGHTRRTRSLALGKGTMSPQELVWALGGQATPPPLPARRGAPIPSHHPHSRKISVTTGLVSPGSSVQSPPVRPSLKRLSSSTSDVDFNTISASDSTSSLHDHSDLVSPRPKPQRPSHSRIPSYHNAYGASTMGLTTPTLQPPPIHPYVRSHPPPNGAITIFWAYAQLVAHFHPSNAYIPPDPLLPLRSLLLHQPVGSGSLTTDSKANRGSLSFGTGTIGNSTQPSLTGSLFGLAKDLVYGGSGGSLEEERKRVWNMKDLPVLETTRSLLGVDVTLQEGESKEFSYIFQLPTNLPPTHHGKAFRFSYDFAVSLDLASPGGKHRQKTKTMSVPIRIWSNVTFSDPVKVYDVLCPVIQTKDEATVEERPITPQMSRRSSAQLQWNTENSLNAYAAHLINTSTSGSLSARREPPLSPSRVRVALDAPPTAGKSDLLSVPLIQSHLLKGDEQLLDSKGDCGEAVEVLSRHSGKASYDITKDGSEIAVLTLIKTTYRLGETVLGVVNLNEANAERVLRFSAFLESREIIPEQLLPDPNQAQQPNLTRLYAEHRSSYAVSATRSSFALDIPSDATPAFALAAGNEGARGGLEWRVRLSFLVAVRKRRGKILHLMPESVASDLDNQSYSALKTLIPVLSTPPHAEQSVGTISHEMPTETVECVVPVQVLAGNTAFVVRPSVWAV